MPLELITIQMQLLCVNRLKTHLTPQLHRKVHFSRGEKKNTKHIKKKQQQHHLRLKLIKKKKKKKKVYLKKKKKKVHSFPQILLYAFILFHLSIS